MAILASIGERVSVGGLFLELFGFGRSGQRARRALARGNHGCDRVEVTGAHKALVLYCAVSMALSQIEFALLQLRVSRHPGSGVLARQIEHREIQCVESG